jgi:hypothetical protein
MAVIAAVLLVSTSIFMIPVLLSAYAEHCQLERERKAREKK